MLLLGLAPGRPRFLIGELLERSLDLRLEGGLALGLNGKGTADQGREQDQGWEEGGEVGHWRSEMVGYEKQMLGNGT